MGGNVRKILTQCKYFSYNLNIAREACNIHPLGSKEPVPTGSTGLNLHFSKHLREMHPTGFIAT